jgi:hypothetical protein
MVGVGLGFEPVGRNGTVASRPQLEHAVLNISRSPRP